MSENGNGVNKGPRVDGMIRHQRMEGEDTVSLEVRGEPDDSLGDVLDAWDERVDRLLDHMEADQP